MSLLKRSFGEVWDGINTGVTTRDPFSQNLINLDGCSYHGGLYDHGLGGPPNVQFLPEGLSKKRIFTFICVDQEKV